MPLGTNVGSVFFDIKANQSAFKKEIKGAAGQAQSVFSSAMGKVGKAIGVAFSAAAVVSFGKKCVEVASETQSAWVGLSSILNGQKKSFSEANRFIQDYISDGLVPLNNAVTAYKNLAARGYSTEQIEKTMTALKDAAAFGRQASYSYGDAISTATEGLKNENSILVDNAGVTKNVAKMWEDYAKSIGTTTNALTQQQKIEAEVNGILQETKWQTGDAAKYATTFAGRVAKLSATFTSLKTEIGNVIIPILNLFIPAIQTALDALLKFLGLLKTAMASIGLEMPDVTSLGGVTAGATEAAEAIDNTGTAAEKAAKKVKKAFASYDEINVLSKSSASDTGTGGSSAGASGVEAATIGGVNSLKDQLSSASAELGTFFDPLADAWQAHGEPIVQSIKNAFNNLKEVGKGVGDVIKNWWQGEGGRSFANTTLELFEKIARAAERVTKSIKYIWDNGGKDTFNNLVKILGNVGEIIMIVVGYIADLYGDLVEGFAPDAAEGLQGVNDKLSAFNGVLEWLKTDGKPILEGIAYTIGLVGAAWLAYKGIMIAVEVASKAYAAAQAVVNAVMNANPIGIIVTLVAALIAVIILCAKHWDELKAAASRAWDGIKAVWATVANWFSVNIIEPIKNFFSNLWAGIMTTFANVKTYFQQKFSEAWAAIKGVFAPVGSFFSGIWETIRSKFSTIGTKVGETMGNAFKTVVNKIISFAERTINGFIRAINRAISLINNIPGVSISPLSELNVPKLAQGGWVAANNPQLAIVGDNTREGEIVSPESKIREQVELALAKAGGCAQKVKLQLELLIRYPDGRTIIKTINEAQIAEGRILLEV
jgi:phage-related protein|nr:MAG TPA: minor tail protein [Caudoviricetes sp.]